MSESGPIVSVHGRLRPLIAVCVFTPKAQLFATHQSTERNALVVVLEKISENRNAQGGIELTNACHGCLCFWKSPSKRTACRGHACTVPCFKIAHQELPSSLARSNCRPNFLP